MIFGNVPKLHGLVGCGVLIAAAAVPIGCGDDQFSGCEASRTCPPATGGDAGGGGEPNTGGSSGSGSGKSGSGGNGGSTAGRGGTSGEGGEGGSPDGEGGEGGSDEPDTTPPTVLSVLPEDGEIGVRADANLVITFSEPMDRVSTQAGYQSTDIPAGAVAFSWNDENTVLTVNPASDLGYADGADQNVVARVFAATVTTTAEDEAGNRLADDFAWSFRTLRRIEQSFFGGSLVRISSGSEMPVNCTLNSVSVGDNDINEGRFLLVSRDISGLPEGIVEWEEATLLAEKVGSGGQETLGALGPLMTYHMSVWPPESATWTTPYLSVIGPLASDATQGPKAVEVRDALSDDYEHRSERNQMSQYRISFGQISNGDEIANTMALSCSAFGLRTRYLIP